ncbi:4-alpha-glucanotransferase [Caldimonas sp. KR1-144]|uniref:4-alpha-glucanotransferase n=1 Tax=Caldimonas sp. KR1-144 TaxID=3400911 RepID=UPI003C0A3C58
MHRRMAGVLLHPTSLPGPHGSGDLGPAAFHFIDWLAAGAQSVWQVLPLTPVGYGNSPYAGVSAFAGSPLMVAIEPMVEHGWLRAPTREEIAGFDATRVDFDRVAPWRMARLREAEAGFRARGAPVDRESFAAFCAAQGHWLDDYALFMAIDGVYRAREVWSWTRWENALARRETKALVAARVRHAGEIAFWQFVQWQFFTQWRAVMDYAHARGVTLIGDLPIFVAHHSADCWAHPGLFRLDAQGEPSVVAGVPPDFFSATGQRWGNPLYDWDAMARDGFAWWIARLNHELARADLVRIDHFRGFAGYWEIPASCPTAIEGRWVPAPGEALFDALQRAGDGALPVIAEDLGVITPDVEALRDAFALPGMKILQFGFAGDGSHAFLPHNYPANCCVYTGTHDNDTARGWWLAATERERGYAAAYLGTEGAPAGEHNVHWAMIRCAWASVARIAVCQMQDVLGLDSSARMNVPGQLGHWTWRFQWSQVGPEPAERLARLSAAYGRASIDRLALAAYPAGHAMP